MDKYQESLKEELMVIRQTIAMRTLKDEEWNDVFHTRCRIQDRVCRMIIDRVSVENFASLELVEKLNLTTTKHPRPYTLYLLNKYVEVKEQVLVSFSLGRYQGEVLCEVVPMNVTHVLFGKPWIHASQAKHIKSTNYYKVPLKDGKHTTFVPLSQKELYDDRVKMQRKREEELQRQNSDVELVINGSESERVVDLSVSIEENELKREGAVESFKKEECDELNKEGELEQNESVEKKIESEKKKEIVSEEGNKELSNERKEILESSNEKIESEERKQVSIIEKEKRVLSSNTNKLEFSLFSLVSLFQDYKEGLLWIKRDDMSNTIPNKKFEEIGIGIVVASFEKNCLPSLMIPILIFKSLNEEMVEEVPHEDHLLPLELASKESSLKEEEVVVHEEVRAINTHPEIMEEEKVLVQLEVQRIEEEKEIEEEDASDLFPNIDFVFPNDFFDVSLTKFQIFQVLQVLKIIKEERWQFYVLLILLLHHFKTRGRVFSNKGRMIHTREVSSLLAHNAIPWSLIRGRIILRKGE